MTLRPICFVLMPFGRKRDPYGGPELDFERHYSEAIVPAIIDAGLEPIRGDEERTGGIIHKYMFERLVLSDFVIADLTTLNANVLYELGIRHAAKPAVTIPIFAGKFSLPFDVNMVRALPYDLDERNRMGDTEAAALRERLGERLRRIRAEVHTREFIDSPFYQLLEVEAPKLEHMRAVAFRTDVAVTIALKERLAKARREQDVGELNALALELGEMDEVEDGVAIDLFLSYRALKAWDRMIALFERLPHRLCVTQLFRELLAFALNRVGKKDQAERILLDLLDERGPSSYTLALLGHVYEDQWMDALEADDTVLASGCLDRAIETYVRGFKADSRDYYPGISALVLMEASEHPHPLRDDLHASVRFATSTAIEAGTATGYIEYSTLLQLAVLDTDRAGAEAALVSALASAGEAWELEATARSTRIVRRARQGDGVESEWLRSIETELLKAASPLGSLLASGSTIERALRSNKEEYGKEQLAGWLAAATSRVSARTGPDHPSAAELASSARTLTTMLKGDAGAGALANVLAGYLKQIDSMVTEMLTEGPPIESGERGSRYDLFLSYAFQDHELALELKDKLEEHGLSCFLAEKDIGAGRQWQDEVFQALAESARILLLLTPRSHDREWIMLELGAALALRKEVIPALAFVKPADVIEPVRKFQARIIETEQQKLNLIRELAGISLGPDTRPRL